MTIATTTFLKLNQSHFKQPIDYLPTPSQNQTLNSDTNDFYQQHHQHYPYHYYSSHHHQYYPHVHCPPSQCDHGHYGTSSGSGKSYAHHTYQTIGPSTISSSIQQHYAKPDNMGNIEIIESKKMRSYDEMNNEI